MALLCLFGVCIPYSVIWPFILLFLKQVWEFVFQKPKVKKNKGTDGDEILANKDILEIDLHGSSVYLTKSMDWNAIISRERFTIVRFTASWCKPCKELEPLFNELSIKWSLKATFVNIDVDEFDELSAEHSAISIPLFLCFQKGVVVKRLSGNDRNKLTTFIDDCLNVRKALL